MRYYLKKLSISFKTMIFVLLVMFCFLLLLGVNTIYYFNSSYLIKSHDKDIRKAKEKDNSKYHTIGWISVEGTDLNMPVYYLDNNVAPVNREKYSWDVHSDGKFHNKMNIMGHNIFNLSSKPMIKSSLFYRFEELMSFIYYDFSKKNQYIQLSMNNKEYVYKIFSVSFLSKFEISTFPTGEYSIDEINKQISLLKDNSIYDYNIDVNSDDKLISLITCTRFFDGNNTDEFIVSGRLVRAGERLNHYYVGKNKKYEKIEKILGGNENEEDMEVA